MADINSETDVAVGGEIDSWCTKCKLELNHTVAAKVDGKVKRVVCLTCGGQHAYSRKKARNIPTKPKPAAAPKKPRKRPGFVDDGRAARPYALASSFVANDFIEHTQYGRGRVTQVRQGKIDVEFVGGTRTLVHERAPG